jgi:hypothetical protein
VEVWAEVGVHLARGDRDRLPTSKVDNNFRTAAGVRQGHFSRDARAALDARHALEGGTRVQERDLGVRQRRAARRDD